MAYTPTGATGHESWGNLVEAGTFAHYVIDRPIVSLWNNGNLTGGCNNSLAGGGAGAPVVSATKTPGVTIGMIMDADSDAHQVIWPLPMGIDLSKNIDFRILYNTEDTSGTILWVIYYEECVIGTYDMGSAAASTVLSTALTASDASGTADYAAHTAWGTLDGGTLTCTPGDDFLVVNAVYGTETTLTEANIWDVHARFYRRYF